MIMEANSGKSSNMGDPAPPGSSPPIPSKIAKAQPNTLTPLPSSKGVENAKKRLRAFSIQKKTTPLSPIVPKPLSTGNTTVLIGKLSSVKTTPKVDDESKKLPPKPPKPGGIRKSLQDSYPDQQRRTLKEIEDMKRKMELVELGIPLGLICPTSTNEKAMPTKAMPPIKTFLDEAKVDEIIREAKKIRGEGKQFKFDYNKLLPDYDNPFQRKRDDHEKEHKPERHRGESEKRDKKSDKYEFRRHPSYRKDDRDRYKERDREKSKERSKNKDDYKESSRRDSESVEEKEADVNLKDFLVCDSWSLENDDITNSCSPKTEEKAVECKSPEKADTENKATEDKPLENKVTENIQFTISKDPSQQLKENMSKKIDVISDVILRNPNPKARKIDKLQPVMDAFKYEIDEPNEDEILDIFDEDSNLEKYSHVKTKSISSYDSPKTNLLSYEQEAARDASMDGMNDDTFLESVINEIKDDDNLCDETSPDKRLVEYDESPNKEEFDSPAIKGMKTLSRVSITPELDDRMIEQSKQKRHNLDKKESSKRNTHFERKGQVSQRSDYSDGRRSSESGYKTSDTIESNPKYVENFGLSIERELDAALERSTMAKATIESLETWSFVLKICQPLLFRHDKNKCYRETRSAPKLWFTENPKTCFCVKDRAIVYQELEMLKMGLVDRVYGCDQIADTPSVNARAWYPRSSACLAEGKVQPVASEWEADDSQQGQEGGRPDTPQRSEEIMLDREYQRFMQAVWPEVADAKAADTSRSTTPIRQESKKKKKEEKIGTETEDRKPKKMKLSSEGWSQESDMEDDGFKSKKVKMSKNKEKSRKRKRSLSSLSTISDSDSSAKKKRKASKRKALKKAKSKEAKRRKIGKKLLKKLKEKQKQKKKAEKEASADLELQEEKKKELKKRKKKKQQKLKKKNQKRKKKESSSSTDSSSTTTSSSETDSDLKAKKRKRSSDRSKKQKRKKFSSDSQSEELFDVNILNNIKTERLTDDEKGQKLLEFSARHHKPREIINVKELQNDFVGNNKILIKKEVEDLPEEHIDKGREKYSEKQIKETEKELYVAQKESVKPQKEVIEVEKESLSTENEFEEKHVVDSEENSVNLDTMIVSPPLPIDPPTPSDSEKGSEFKEPQEMMSSGASITVIDESNMSQCSSQESVCSVKESSSYEKDESHLRPSSQNSNYSFNDVIASQSGHYPKAIESVVDNQDKYTEGYEHEAGNYEMYEQLAMAYQSDVASQASSSQDGTEGGCGVFPQRIETVVRVRARGEIKCDWRADHPHHPTHTSHPARTLASPAQTATPTPATHRPSRWGLKPNEVNIVLTGGEQYIQPNSPQPVYKIQSLANRTDVPTDYDEAYMDMYGASDRLQYGDCFATDTMDIDNMNMTNMVNMANLASIANMVSIPHAQPNVTNIEQVPLPTTSPAAKVTEPKETRSTLDARIDKALRETVLGEVAKDIEPVEDQKDLPEKGILLSGNVAVIEPGRGVKRVSFADGYKPGQDSDVEEPPIKKRRRSGRTGCAWPCPATHPDHVPLWDALPPPPPPPGSPPRSCRRALTRPTDSSIPLGGFMPPEPPPGLISF